MADPQPDPQREPQPEHDLARLEAAFAEACDLPPGERTAYIDRHSPDPSVRARLRALLDHDARATDAFLAGAPDDSTPGARASPDVEHTEGTGLHQPGDLIARYRLQSLIGSGGFGEVWLAEQQTPVTRPVALKIIKPGMDTRELIARFEAERQTLALLEHPSIAKVFDAGATDRARPFFVMEYVDGAPITRYCRDQALDIPARLALFLDVCAGVQHAHQKGVIHRDLKPSNILVRHTAAAHTPPSPAPVIIDFGIAKTVQSALAPAHARTSATRGGLLGTPEYMSPEQAGLPGPGGAIAPPTADTRSDVYSLGVILYELLVGAQPFRRSGALDPVELRRRILEDTPARPSSRVMDAPDPNNHAHNHASADTPAHAPRHRRILRDHLRGDLDWIVLKALEKEPARRYSSVAELAADLRRHLAHEPVLAGPPGVRYRARKFIRRHRTAAASVAAIAVMLLLATALSTRFAISESRQRLLAERRAAVASLAAAHAALVDENQPLAIKNLDLVPPDLRGWEWQHLHHRADGARYHLPPHDGVLGVVAPAKSDRIFTLDSRGLLRSWNTADGRELARVQLASGEGGDGTFGLLIDVDPDPSRAIVLTHAADTAAVFDLASGRLVRRIPNVGVPALRRGTTEIVATAPDPPRILIIDAATGAERALPIPAPQLRRTTLIDPSGTLALAQNYADSIAFSLDDARIVARPEARSAAWCLSTDGPTLWLQAGISGKIDFFALHDLATGRTTRLDFPPLSVDVATTLSADLRTALVIDRQRARLLHAGLPDAVPLTRLAGRITGMAIDHPSATPPTTVVLAAEHTDVSAWDIDAFAIDRATSIAALRTATAAISPSANLIARGGWGDVSVWNAYTGSPVWRRAVFPLAQTTTVAWSADGSTVVAASHKGALAVIDPATGAITSRAQLPFTPTWLAVSSNAGRIYAGGPPGRAVVAAHAGSDWSIAPFTLSHQSATSAGILSADGASLAVLGVVAPNATAAPPAALDVFDTADPSHTPHTLHLRWSRPSTSTRAAALAFSPDATTLWAATEHDTVLVAHDGASGEETARYLAGLAPVTAIADCARGERIAALAADGTLAVWSTGTRDAMSVWPCPSAIALRFTPDERDLVVSAIEQPVIRLETGHAGGAGELGQQRLAAARGAALAERVSANPLGQVVQDAVAASGAPADVVSAALEYMRRIGDSANHCNSDAWRVGLLANASRAEYEMAMRHADAACAAYPNNGGILNTRALVLLRLGRWDEAVAEARRSDELLTAPGARGIDINAAITAMAHHGAGRTEDARRELARLNAMLPPATDNRSQESTLIDEARRLIAP